MNSENMKQETGVVRNLRSCVASLAILGLMLGISSTTWGKEHKSQPAGVQVVGQMSFGGKVASDMAIHQANGKSYLYVQLSQPNGVVVLDITQPAKLKTVTSMLPAVEMAASHVSIDGNVALVAGDTGYPSGSVQTQAREQLVLWDISQPGNPRMVHEFSGVAKVIHDDRNFIYVLDREGLWVVADTQSPSTMDSSTYNGG
jgi:hypothetical protein